MVVFGSEAEFYKFASVIQTRHADKIIVERDKSSNQVSISFVERLSDEEIAKIKNDSFYQIVNNIITDEGTIKIYLIESQKYRLDIPFGAFRGGMEKGYNGES